MKRRTGIVMIALAALIMLGQTTRWPASKVWVASLSSNLADLLTSFAISTPQGICSLGLFRGGNYDSSTSLYSWTCGNYNWSAEVGGVDGSNISDYDTATTVGGNSWISHCTGDGTSTEATIEQLVCMYNGEPIHNYIAADIMLAQDNTVRGGTIYLPRGLYMDAGCGQSADGTPNGCPVLQEIGTNFVRKIDIYGGRRLVGEHRDMDGPLLNGREGTWIILDHGSNDIATCGVGNDEACDLDRDASGVQFNHWAVRVGTDYEQRATCYRDLTDDGCVAQTTVKSVPASSWGSYSTQKGSTDTFSAALNKICFDNTVATTGTCSGDRRVHCTAAGARTGANTGGCDFTGGGGPDLGTCEGFVTAIETELAAGEEIRLVIGTDFFSDPTDEFTANTGGAQAFYAMAGNVTAGTCGDAAAGRLIEFEVPETGNSTWPLAWSVFDGDFHSTKTAYVVSDEVFNNVGGGIESINFMQASYELRDSANNDADCATVGTDEACDEIDVWAVGGGIGGSFKNNTIWYASARGFGFSVVDGTTWGFGTIIEDNLFSHGRGLAADASGWIFRQNQWEDWYSDVQMFSMNFNHGGVWERDTVRNVQAQNIVSFSKSHGLTIRDIQLYSILTSYGLFRASGGGNGVLVDGIKGHGIRGPLVSFHNANNGGIFGAHFSNFQIRAWNPTNPNANVPYAAIWVGDLNNAQYKARALENVLLSKWDVTHYGSDDPCLIFFEGGTGTEADTANGMNRPIVQFRDEFTFRDISLAAVGTETGTSHAFCLGNYGSAANEADERLGDIWASASGIPRWENVSVNGNRFPDNPLGSIAVRGATLDSTASVDDATEIITYTGHGLVQDDVVQATVLTGTLPTGLSAATNYYVLRPVNATGPNALQLSATKGGSAINLTDAVGTFTLLTGREPDCDELGQGTPVRIWNDATPGGCLGAASDSSLLNGGGSSISLCECGG